MTPVLQPSRWAASATEISPAAQGPGTGILWTWRIHWTASMSKGRPGPVASPAALSRRTSSSLLVAGPSCRTSSTAAAGVRLAVPGWTGRSAVSSLAAPVCQRMPMRTLSGRCSGSRVTSAIRVRSSRLRSLALVAGAFQRAGRFAASFSSSARLGSGGSVSRAASSACPGSVRAAGLRSGCEGAGDQPVFWFHGVECALGPVSVVAGALGGELGGPADPLVPAGDLVSGRQGEGDLPGGGRGQQRGRDRGIHAGRGDRPARRRGEPVPAGAALIGRPLIGVVVGHHRLAAAAAGDDPLAQRDALPRWPGTGGGVVGGQLRLAGQVVRPGDVALVVVFDQDRPFSAGPFGDRGVHRAGRVDGAA